MSARPSFDPRIDVSTHVREHAPIAVSRKDANGVWITRAEPQRTMSVFIDGVEQIEDGLMIDGGDPLVAFNPCGVCGEWVCNLVEGWAAKVRRIGPYVVWIRASGETFVFDVERYRAVFGGHVESLPGLSADDAWDLDEPATSVVLESPDGRSLVLDVSGDPDGPLARLRAWPVVPLEGIVAVAPPARAIEIRARTTEASPNRDAASSWIDMEPREDGRRAGYFPGIVRVPVWIGGPEVDGVVAALVG